MCLRRHVENIAARLINEQLIRPLNRSFGRGSGRLVSFSGREMHCEEPWMPPEENDMEAFPLPCCDRQIKVDQAWVDRVHCHFCGFTYPARDSGAGRGAHAGRCG